MLQWARALYGAAEENPFTRFRAKRRTTGRRLAHGAALFVVGVTYLSFLALVVLRIVGDGPQFSQLGSGLLYIAFQLYQLLGLVGPGLTAGTFTEELENGTALSLCLTTYPRQRMFWLMAWARIRPLGLAYLALLPLAVVAPLLSLEEGLAGVAELLKLEAHAPVVLLLVLVTLPLLGLLAYAWQAANLFFGMSCGLYASTVARTNGGAVALAYGLAIGIPCVFGTGLCTATCLGGSLVSNMASGPGGGATRAAGAVGGMLALGAVFLFLYFAVYVVLPILVLRGKARALDALLTSR